MSKDVRQLEKELKAEMPFKWKVQAVSKYKPTATCVAYIDARDAMDRLDEVMGIDKWQDSYERIGDILYCTVSLNFNGQWRSKTDCGIESNMEKEKGQSSDAFKRACVKWGIGRFLYSKDVAFVTTNEKKSGGNHPYPVDSSGKRIWDLTKHINQHGKHSAKPAKPKKETKKEKRNKEIKKAVESCGKKLDKEHVEIVKGLMNKPLEDMNNPEFDELLEAIKYKIGEE